MDDDYRSNEALILHDITMGDTIYVTIDFLKYIELGRILSHQNITRPQYTEIVNIVSDESFLLRHTNDTSALLKDVMNIGSVINEPNARHDDIAMVLSPAFDGAVEMIQRCLTASDVHRKLSKSGRSASVTIDVSTLPGLTNSVCERIAAEYTEIFRAEVKLTSRRLGDVDTGSPLRYDVYYISDLTRFNDDMVSYLDSERMYTKHLICSRILPLSKLDLPHVDLIDKTLVNIELMMTAATQFHYVKPFACLT